MIPFKNGPLVRVTANYMREEDKPKEGEREGGGLSFVRIFLREPGLRADKILRHESNYFSALSFPNVFL